MRRILTLVLTLAIMTVTGYSQVRYIDEIFTDVVKMENQLYSVNITVVTGVPAVDTLYFDLYMPAGDTCSLRPLAIVLHTGTFLPRGLFAPTGDKDDYANVQICERLAKQGYVAASVQYRAGWNPVSLQDTVRRSTIINAAYRGIQDLYAFIRFANMTVVDFGNPYKIDTSRVAVWGIGTGAFVGFNAAILQQQEIYIDKFTNPSGRSMIDTLLVGDLHGEKPGLINIPNHVGYNDNFHFAFGLDGAIGDSTWLEDGKSVPLVAGGTVTHPTTPYGIDPITGEINCDLPVYTGAGTGGFVVNVGGSACLVEKANSLGLNAPLNKISYDDPVSAHIRTNPNVFGQEHLWGINMPSPQTGPWEYWDAAFWNMFPHPLAAPLTIHQVALSTNPDMSIDKANRYIDTALWVFSPRAYTALKLNELLCASCEGVVPDPGVVMVNDFECQRDFDFGSGNDRLMIMDNPDPEAGYDSEKVGAYLEAANDPWAALCAVADTSFDLSTHNVFMVDINSPQAGVPVLIKLEGDSLNAPTEIWVNTTASANTWETLTADFSAQASTNYTRICLFPNGGENSPAETTYLFDNLRFVMSTSIQNPPVSKLDISPNPVDNVIYIRNPGEAVHFRMINTLGQQVQELRIQGQEIASMIVSHLDPGFYMIAAYNSAGKLVANARIVKN